MQVVAVYAIMSPVIDMERSHIDKIASTPEDRVLLARLWDKINSGIRKNIPIATCFLTQREQAMAQFLFGNMPGLFYWGGFQDAQRKALVYLPDYLEEDYLYQDDGPIVCLRAVFYKTESPSHRDFLGALMGLGLAREVIGDILVFNTHCDFFVSEQIAPFLMESFESAGRTSIKLTFLPLSQVVPPEENVEEIHDTVPSLRLDSIVSAGFRISRGKAGDCIAAGRVSVDGLPCEKADKLISQGSAISLRGMGKIKLHTVGHETKKGRISILIQRYV